MARRFDGSDDAVTLAIGPASAEGWGPATAAAVVKRGADGSYHSILMTMTSGSVRRGSIAIDTANSFYSFPNDVAAGFTVVAADGWVFLAWCKATGTSAPRFHKYVYSTGVWTQNTPGTTVANATSAGAGGFWKIGAEPSAAFFNGDMAAVCYISRVLNDAEIRLMPGGDWWQWSPRFWREFPSGLDRLVLGRAIGSDGTRDTTLVGTARSPLADPPGFRFSPRTRRGR